MYPTLLTISFEIIFLHVLVLHHIKQENYSSMQVSRAKRQSKDHETAGFQVENNFYSLNIYIYRWDKKIR